MPGSLTESTYLRDEDLVKFVYGQEFDLVRLQLINASARFELLSAN